MTKARDPKKRVWRTTARKGERVLIDPDGNIWRGTAQEVERILKALKNGIMSALRVKAHERRYDNLPRPWAPIQSRLLSPHGRGASFLEV